MQLTKIAPAAVLTGTSFSYVLEFENTGTTTATGVTIVDAIPNLTSYISDSMAIQFNDDGNWYSLTDKRGDDAGQHHQIRDGAQRAGSRWKRSRIGHNAIALRW